MSDRSPSADDIREAWILWSAWKRLPAKGREAAGEEFDRWKELIALDMFSSGFNAHARISNGNYTEVPITEEQP